jgi:hypothetical protein
MLTPYPGTKIFNKMRNEGRLLTENWRYYDHNTVVFQPKHMSPLELQVGRLWAVQEFTKLSATMRRFLTDFNHPFAHLALNLGCRKSINNEIRDFPRLATELYQAELDALQDVKGFSLASVRVGDFFTRRVQNQVSAF